MASHGGVELVPCLHVHSAAVPAAALVGVAAHVQPVLTFRFRIAFPMLFCELLHEFGWECFDPRWSNYEEIQQINHEAVQADYKENDWIQFGYLEHKRNVRSFLVH